MIELNLLPQDLKGIERKKFAIKIKLPKIATTPLIIGVISLLFLGQGLIVFMAVTQKNRLTKLNAEFGKIAPQEEVAAALKKEADELNRKYAVIESLTSGSLIWSKKLYDLSAAMIDGVWLTSLSLNMEKSKDTAAVSIPGRDRRGVQPAEGQILILKGSAVSPSPGEETAIVGKFIESLRKNKAFFGDFDDIRLSSIKRRKLDEAEIMDFTIVCYFKPGRSYFEKLEAANI